MFTIFFLTLMFWQGIKIKKTLKVLEDTKTNFTRIDSLIYESNVGDNDKFTSKNIGLLFCIEKKNVTKIYFLDVLFLSLFNT